MGFYLITHLCGHSQYRSVRDWDPEYRDKRLQVEASRPCTDCWKAEQDELWAQEAREVGASNQALGLPPLIGTSRQVAWAEIIRSKMAADLAQVVDLLKKQRYLRQRPIVLLGAEAIAGIIDDCVTEYMRNPSAQFFITVHTRLDTHFKKLLFSRLRIEAMKLSVDAKERT